MADILRDFDEIRLNFSYVLQNCSSKFDGLQVSGLAKGSAPEGRGLKW